MLKRWRGLPLQLFALIILPLTVVLLVIAFGSLALHQRAMRSLVGERDQRAASAAAGAIAEQLKHRSAAVRSLVLQAEIHDAPEEALDSAGYLLPDFEGGLALFNSDGSLLASLGISPQAGSTIWSARIVGEPLLQAGPENFFEGGAKLLPVFTDPIGGELTMLAAASSDTGLTVVGAFRPANLARRALVDIFAAGDAASAFVVDDQGQVLYRMGTVTWPNEQLPQHPGVIDALRGESGTTYLAVEGDEHVIAFSPVPQANWALIIEEPWQAVADPLLRTTEIGPLLLAPALVVTIIALWFGVRQIVGPLQSLEQKATELAWGNFETIHKPVGGIAEISRLQQELVHMAEKVQRAQQGLRGYLGAVTAGQEEERRRLARELHDDTLQSLVALNQRVQLAQLDLEGHPVAEKLDEMRQMTTQLIADLRRFTHDLRPTYLEDLGLVPALDMLARDTAKTVGIPVEFQVTGSECRLRSEVELALYRMVQEALNNVARHAQANRAAVHMAFTDYEIQLTVSDDGYGFEIPESPAEMAPAGHFGLLGLYERAELIGAHLDIQSEPGQGTRVSISIPNPTNRTEATLYPMYEGLVGPDQAEDK